MIYLHEHKQSVKNNVKHARFKQNYVLDKDLLRCNIGKSPQ